MLVSMQVDDLGIDYLERRNDYIEAVTLDDVRRAARRLYHPGQLLTVVVGDPEGLQG
jgi:zinc protease